MKQKIKITIFSILIILAISLTVACKTTEFIPDFSQDRMMDTIRLLSAEDGGRIAGFDGEAAAADYIADEFNSMGLKVSEQNFPIKSFYCDNVSLSLLTDGVKLKEAVKVLTFSAATKDEGITAEIISVGMGADTDYQNIEVSGKIALIMRGGEFFRVKTERAHEMGAVAAVFYDPNGEGALSATLTQLSSIPAISIAREDAENLEKLILEGKSVEGNLKVDSVTADTESTNIFALYKAKKNPDNKCVIVGAHYDGVDTPAANDNASGIAVIMEIAAAISEQKISLPYDVKFIAFGAEEIGLLGSEAYVDSLDRNGLESIIAMLNFDMVGVGESVELLTAGGADAGRLIESAQNVLTNMGSEAIISETDRSDHASFSYAGIQAIDFQMSPALYYHTDMDTHESIQPDNLLKMCELGSKILVYELPGWVN